LQRHRSRCAGTTLGQASEMPVAPPSEAEQIVVDAYAPTR
jgi:hypothetical protein